jgi:hypothetical protein
MAIALEANAATSENASPSSTIALNLSGVTTSNLILVGCLMDPDSNTAATGIAFNTTETFTVAHTAYDIQGVEVEWWYLLNPSKVNSNVVITDGNWNNGGKQAWFACFSDCKQEAPTIVEEDGGSGTSGTMTTSAAGTDMVVMNIVDQDTVNQWETLTTATGGQTDIYANRHSRVNQATGTGSSLQYNVTYEIGEGTMSWSSSGTVDINETCCVMAAGGIEYQQAVAGSQTNTGVMVRMPNKVLAGSQTNTGVIVRDSFKVLVGAMTNTGAIAKAIDLASGFVGSQTNTGALVRQPQKVLAGDITNTGVLTKIASKVLAGAITLSGGVTKAIRKVISMLFDVQIVADVIARIQPINEDR